MPGKGTAAHQMCSEGLGDITLIKLITCQKLLWGTNDANDSPICQSTTKNTAVKWIGKRWKTTHFLKSRSFGRIFETRRARTATSADATENTAPILAWLCRPLSVNAWLCQLWKDWSAAQSDATILAWQLPASFETKRATVRPTLGRMVLASPNLQKRQKYHRSRSAKATTPPKADIAKRSTTVKPVAIGQFPVSITLHGLLQCTRTASQDTRHYTPGPAYG